LLKNESIREEKFDLGHTDTLMYEFSLKMLEPLNVKKLKILNTHYQEVECHRLEWLQLGVYHLVHSKYDSPIFAVMNKDRNVHLVKDFRALNNQF
jgi:hypothetical protein